MLGHSFSSVKAASKHLARFVNETNIVLGEGENDPVTGLGTANNFEAATDEEVDEFRQLMDNGSVANLVLDNITLNPQLIHAISSQTVNGLTLSWVRYEDNSEKAFVEGLSDMNLQHLLICDGLPNSEFILKALPSFFHGGLTMKLSDINNSVIICRTLLGTNLTNLYLDKLNDVDKAIRIRILRVIQQCSNLRSVFVKIGATASEMHHLQLPTDACELETAVEPENGRECLLPRIVFRAGVNLNLAASPPGTALSQPYWISVLAGAEKGKITRAGLSQSTVTFSPRQQYRLARGRKTALFMTK